MAPLDRHTKYRIEASIGGVPLTDGQIQVRYKTYPKGYDERSPHNIFDKIRQYEETYGRGRPADVAITYSVNGAPEEVWRWPAR